MSLKIVFPICCGIDVHKTFVVACIASTNNQGITSYSSRRFSTFTMGLKELLKWLLDSNCSITLAHPKYVKAIRGKKTDKKDAKWIADLFKHDLVAGSFIPPADIRQLRDLMRYRSKLTNFISSEKNRLQNCLTVSNIQLASVVSDTFGKSATNIIDKILANPLDASFDLKPLIHGSLYKKIPDLELAIDGYICPSQADKLKIIKKHYEDLQSRKSELEQVILALAAPYQHELDIILTAPSFANIFSAISIISEIGVNMESFPSAKHLCSWAGLTPTNNESAGKKKSVRVSKAGCYIKPLLVQCANSVVKSDKHPEIRNRFLSIKKRRGHKKAIIAIARMLLTAIYNMLKKNESYNPDFYKKTNAIPFEREITVEQALLLAKRLGYRVAS
jgi:transposase